MIPIIDAHHHLWDLEANAYPWLSGPPVEAHFGPFETIRRNYLVADSPDGVSSAWPGASS